MTHGFSEACGVTLEVINRDLESPFWLKLKGILFLVVGILSTILLLFESNFFESGNWKLPLLVGITIWAFARFYYFAFYVLEQYADPNFRYAGLLELARYLLTGKQTGSPRHPESTNENLHPSTKSMD